MDLGHFVGGQSRQQCREIRHPPLAAAPHHAFALRRRVQARHAPIVGIRLTPDETFLFAYITDISAMGIFVRTNNPEPEGTRLNLCFRAPQELGGHIVEVEGEVIWINPFRPNEPTRQPGMGIQFVDLTQSQRELVMRMVRTFAYLDDDEEEDDGQTIGNS